MRCVCQGRSTSTSRRSRWGIPAITNPYSCATYTRRAARSRLSSSSSSYQACSSTCTRASRRAASRGTSWRRRHTTSIRGTTSRRTSSGRRSSTACPKRCRPCRRSATPTSSSSSATRSPPITSRRPAASLATARPLAFWDREGKSIPAIPSQSKQKKSLLLCHGADVTSLQLQSKILDNFFNRKESLSLEWFI